MLTVEFAIHIVLLTLASDEMSTTDSAVRTVGLREWRHELYLPAIRFRRRSSLGLCHEGMFRQGLS